MEEITISEQAHKDIRERMDRLERALDKWKNAPYDHPKINDLRSEILFAASSLHGYLTGYGF